MKTAFIGNYSIELIAKEFDKTFLQKSYISGYNQYQVEIINKCSVLYSQNPDFTFLLLDGNELFKNRSKDEIKDEINNLTSTFLSNCKGYLIISSVLLYNNINQVQDYNVVYSYKYLQNWFNDMISDLAIKNPNLFVIDIHGLIEKYGYHNLYDTSLWAYGKVRFNKLGNSKIAELCNIMINAVRNETKKCLVLDLDNTLWGGILGEEGMSGIKIGPDGVGQIYYLFQTKIKEIKDKGILLTICSKNNEHDVKEVFDLHKHLYLKWDDFVIKKINWVDKATNIHNIAKELNIGEDSLVFIDDSAFERKLVMESTQVSVPGFPDKVEDLPEFICDVDRKYFSKISITDEDKVKSIQYIENFKRSEILSSSNSLEDFVKSLNIELSIYPALDVNVPRIAQLTQKTNQFNLTTKRYSEAEIRQMLHDEKYSIFYGNATDKIGDYGTVILVILERKDSKYLIDTFLMSCRVIGRFIENSFLHAILKNFDSKEFYARYVPTGKNILVENKYEELGFELLENNNGTKEYKIQKNNIFPSKIIQVKFQKNGTKNY